MNSKSPLRDLSAPAVWAGLTAFVWYAFGAVPLHIGVSEQLKLSTAQTSSWIFIVWFSGALSSIAASFHFRQPIPITWTIPGLIYLGTLAGRFTFAELAGANFIAGLLLLALGLLGVGGRIMSWLPLPIIMGMFAGSILGYVTRMVAATVQDIPVAGTTVGCYLLGRFFNNPRIPPVGLVGRGWWSGDSDDWNNRSSEARRLGHAVLGFAPNDIQLLSGDGH